MEKMAVVVPSRGRPGNVRRLMDARESTGASHADFIFCVDDDDPTLEQYLQTGAKIDVGPRLRLGPTLSNKIVEVAAEYEVVGFMGDDHLPRTPFWDAILLSHLHEMGTGIVYGNDLLQGATIPTSVFMSSDIVKVLGYFCPPGFLHMYLDNVWKDWGEQAGCLQYLPDVIIEHMHPGNGKATHDSSYAESGALISQDQMAYRDYCGNSLESDVAKIKGLRV